MDEEAIHAQIHREASGTQQQPVSDEVTINIEKRIQDCEDGNLTEDCCIYRVPITLRDFKEEAYTPKVVSIGPFHYRNERLQEMEMHKQILFKRFIQRSMSSLDDLVGFVRHFEPQVRASYSESIKLNKQELVEMTLIDAGFIIEFFLMFDDVERIKYAKSPLPWLMNSIIYDLILLENQLPFFIIEEIFKEAFPHDCRSSLPSFRTRMFEVFNGFITPHNFKPTHDIKIRHFTDLLRLFHLQGRTPSRDPFSTSHILSYNASALQEAGIKLKIRTDSTSLCLLDLKFSGRNLEIPQIYVHGKTEIMFRNMIALEQCHYPYDSYITDYAIVLDILIDTYKDVDVLVQKEIFKSFIGDSNGVARLFNGLPINCSQPTVNSEYQDICKRLNDYCQDPRHKMMATLRRDYCNTPWRTVASVAGIILLVLTIVQTIFSVLQVVQN